MWPTGCVCIWMYRVLVHVEPCDTMLGVVHGYVSLERSWCVPKQIPQFCGWLLGCFYPVARVFWIT